MINFDDNNLFGDDFDLLSESADSLFASTPKPTAEKNKNDTDVASKNKQSDVAKENLDEQKGKQDNLKQEQDAKTEKQDAELKSDKKNEETDKKEKSKKSKKDKNKEDDTQLKDQEKTLENGGKTQEKLEDKNATQGKKDGGETKPKAKQKKPKKTLKKSILILIIVLSAVVLLGATGGITYYVLISAKLETPVYSVYQYSTGTIIAIDEVKGATSYEVTISQQNKKDVVFKSSSTTIELQSYLNQPGVFNIKIRALGKVEKANSEYSETKTITSNVSLKSPEVFRDQDIISWNPVDKAYCYRVYYGLSEYSYGEVAFKTISQSSSVISFDLTRLNENGAGKYFVCVQAMAEENTYYLDSEFSTSIEYENYMQLQAPIKTAGTSPVYSNSSKQLEFKLFTQLMPNKLRVVFTLQETNEIVEYTIFAKDLAQTDGTYNSKPIKVLTASFADILDKNVSQATIYAVSETNYATDSEIVEVTINA